MTSVYWIFDEMCADIQNSGYVGVSKDAVNRVKTHIRKCRVPNNSQFIIVFEGSRDACFAHELKLRPSRGIGWNRAIGGAQGWKVGFSLSKEAKAKISVAKLGKKQKFEHIAKRIAVTIGQKRPKQSKSMLGSRNPMYGTKRPLHVVDAIRRGCIGKFPHNRQEIYCVGCRQKVNKTTLVKYHTKCFVSYYKLNTGAK